MDHITASAESLMQQACMTADDYLRAAIKRIDAQMGEGAAKANPQLVGAFMQVAAADYGAALQAAVAQDASMNVAAISDSLDRIARAIAERD